MEGGEGSCWERLFFGGTLLLMVLAIRLVVSVIAAMTGRTVSRAR
jgi:hypothetical protein